jgi:hypothetical protein
VVALLADIALRVVQADREAARVELDDVLLRRCPDLD